MSLATMTYVSNFSSAAACTMFYSSCGSLVGFPQLTVHLWGFWTGFPLKTGPALYFLYENR